MKQRQKLLSKLMTEHYGIGNNPGNSLYPNDLKRAGLTNEVNRIWKNLGGIGEAYPLLFGDWDMILEGFILELDEEQHFNRYRATTLKSFTYHVGNGFELIDYTRYCLQYENECLEKSSWGKYWTSPSIERQFGLPGINGDLEGNGSPRWRQRAFYDYLRDVFAMIYRIPLIRVSIYDKIIANGLIKSVGTILIDGNTSDLNEIVKFIGQKVNRIC